jgi:TonB family protein
MVAHEVRVKTTGVHPGKSERELFTEETTSVLVHENGGIIQLSAAVAPGQLLFLANVESKREVVAQVKRKRTNKPTSCYVELEFAEPAPRFWGMEFSAAAALLPKDAKDTEAAALLISAEATADEPGEPPPAPTVEEVQALRREIEALREQSQLIPPGAAVMGRPLPIERDDVPTQLTAAEQALLPRPSLDFSRSLPKARRLQWARGNFTPGFREGVLRLALLTTALVITAAGAAWYKHWIPWRSAAKKTSASVPAIAVNPRTALPPGSREAAKEHSEFSNTKVASGTPEISPRMPSRVTESPAQPYASSGSTAQPGVSRMSASATLPGKHAMVRPTARATSDPIVASPLEGAIVPPKLIKSVRAVASLDDLRDFETGNVVIDAVVGPEGEVHFIRVLSGPPSLRAPAVEAVKQYQYEPATRNGQPVPAHVNITVRFRFES